MPPAAIFLSTAKEIWKRTPPKTDGFWISLSSNCNCGAKRFRTESPALLSPLPLPRSTRWCAQIAPAVFKLASLSLPRTTLMVPCAIIVPASAHLRIPAHSRLILRRGRRPRRPASTRLRIPAHFRLSLRRGRRPRRPVFRSPIAGCTRVLHVCLRRPYFFQQRKKYGKERRQKPTVFGFPFRPIVTAVQKDSAPNRLYSRPRCRSCVPRGGVLLRFCAAVAAAPRPRTKRYPSGRAEGVSQFT